MSGFKALWISLCLCLIAASLWGEIFVPAHSNHACTGADCPVCLLMRGAENFIRQLKNAAFFSGFQAAAFLMISYILKRAFFLFPPLSTVRLKVKINR